MQHYVEVLRFQEGVRSQHPAPEVMATSASPKLGADAGEVLLVLVDLEPPLPHRSRELRTLATETYWHSSGSVVARLRRALAEANRYLVQVNSKAAPGSKSAGSISCAVFLEDELFFGQVGSAYAFVWHPDGTLELFPQRNRLLIPFGGTLPPVIHVGYTPLEIGSTVFVATTSTAEAQARERWVDALSQETPEEVVAELEAQVEEAHVSGSFALIRIVEETAQPAPPVYSLHARPRAVPRLRERVQKRPPEMARPVVVPEQLPDGETEAVLPVAEEGQGGAEPASSRVRLPAFLQRLAERRKAEPAVETPAAPRRSFSIPRIPRPDVKGWITRWRERRAARQEPSLSARMRRAFRVLLPGQIEDARPAHRWEVPEERPSVLGGISLGVMLLVFIVTATVYFQYGGAARAQELLAEAKLAQEAAFASQESEDWRRLLELSEQVVALDSENLEAMRLRDQAEMALDALEDVAVINAHPLLDLGMAPAPRRLLVAGGWIYVLNTATDQMMGLQLNPDAISSPSDVPASILRRGQTFYGEAVDRLVDLAWIEPGGNYPDGAVFIYSEGGTVYVYEPTLGPESISRQQIRGDLGANAVTLMETFGNKFYLVHRQQNQILTYEPVNGLYDTPRGYFAPGMAPQLQNVLDVGIDGRLYLLMGDGSVKSYFAGTEDHSFRVQNLPDVEFLPDVIAIETDPDSGLIYLGDSQRERIFLLDKHGEFLHQFRLPGKELQNLEALAVAEEPRVLYFIADNQLFAARLPDFLSQ